MFEDANEEVFSDEFVLRTAINSCMMRGCNCEPEITLRKEGKMKVANIRHDPWCFTMQNPDEN